MLEFNITNQTLKRADKFNPATDSVEYLKAKFNFLTADWSGFTKHAIFRLGTEKYEVVIDSKGSCTVPHEVLVCATDGFVQGHRSNKIFVTVYGLAGGVRVTTNEIRVDLAVSGYGEAENSEEPTPTVYEQLVNEVKKDNDETAAEISEIAERAEAAEESALSAESRIRTDYANALKGNVSGEIIRVDDVSPVVHDLKVKAHGKNLIAFPYADGEKEVVRDGVTYTFDTDNGLIINGTPTANTSYNLSMQHHKKVAVKKGKTYTLTCWSNLTAARGYVYLQVFENGENMQSKSVRNNESVSFTAIVDGYVSVGVVVLKDVVFANEKVLVQLEEGATATEYEPYIDPTTVTVKRCGKNLACASYSYEVTQNGLTFTAEKGLSEVKINGTSEKAQSYALMKGIILPRGTYTASLIGANVMDSASDRVYIYNPVTSVVIKNYIMAGKPQTFTIEENTSVNAEMVFAEGSTYSNKAVKLQIERGENATEYEAHKPATVHTPAADGTVNGITSVSPTMTLITDTDGVKIDCEYNVDINTAFVAINNILNGILNGGA